MSGFADDVTPVVIARDEEANIGRTLAQLRWAREVIVVDGLSSDATVQIASSFSNVRVVQRTIDTLAAQWTFAVAQARTAWVLTLDADYFVPDAFVHELEALAPPADVAGYEARFTYAVNGKPLRASLYTPRAVLLRRERCEFYMDGHTQRVQVNGNVQALQTKLVHDDRKPFARFVARQRRYMRDEAEKLRTADPRSLNAAARIRKLIVIAPFAVVFHALFVKGLVFDGVPGVRYAFERFVAELILSRELARRARPTLKAKR
jgi:glycosyltransferase involved in cell wall biosynthesis